LGAGDGSDAATSGDDSAAADSADDCDMSGSVDDFDMTDPRDGCDKAFRSGNVHIGPVSDGQEDPGTDPSDSNSGEPSSEFARWLAPSGVVRSANSRVARCSATADFDELVGEPVHAHQPRTAAPTRTVAHANGENSAGKAGSLRRS